ncbi:hypothetical protein COY28_01120 [Candidatus Woesearchaeota archaeon CG_4_10_14_0_2_um_filter_57_5]|nr:MAG: hypothetical protein COY28_01120 [Candidatus Woesearchaeota archaeon CG_4_10_14_0_2_um_filter_57_5]
MSTKLSITETTLQILALFTHGFDRQYYIREVGTLLFISPRAAQLNLESLESRGVLASTTRGKIRLFRLQHNALAKEYLLLAEQHKTITFLQHNPIIHEITDKATPHMQGICLVFGSYARGSEKKGSDLDVFIAGSADKTRLTAIGKTYGIGVHLTVYSPDIFLRGIRSDALIREVLQNHVVIADAGKFIRAVISSDDHVVLEKA